MLLAISVPERVLLSKLGARKGFLVFVPVRVRVSGRRPSRGIPFPGQHPLGVLELPYTVINKLRAKYPRLLC